MLKPRSLTILFLFSLLAVSCSYFSKKDLRISLKFSNTGTLGPQEIRDLVNQRMLMAFDLEPSAITPGKFSVSEYTFTVKGLPGDTGLEQRILALFRGGVGLRFWEVHTLETLFPRINELNDSLGLRSVKEKFPDSANIDSMEYMKARNPVYLIVRPNQDLNTGRPIFNEGCFAYCASSDTGIAMRLLNSPEAKRIFPLNSKFMIGLEEKSAPGLHCIYCLKTTSEGKPCLEPGQFAEVQKQTSNYGGWLISFTMNSADARKWRFITSENMPRNGKPGRAIAMSINDVVITAPIVQGIIESGRCQLTGNFNSVEADNLVSIMKSGGLPFGVNVLNMEEVK